MAIIHVYPPVGGMGQAQGFQHQEPFTSFHSINFWPIDVKTGRQISAIRPPTTPFSTITGRCNLLANVGGDRVTGAPFNSFAAAIDGQLYYWDSVNMTAATGSQAAALDTDIMLFGDSVINKLYIPRAGEKPLVFNYATGEVEVISETAGTWPSDARILVQWNGALWAAGFTNQDQNIVFATRVGVPTDVDYTVGLDDQFGAWASDTEFDGVISGPITALIPQHRSAMMICTTLGSVVLRSHPRQGGVFEALSKEYPLGQGAWTITPDNTVYFLGPSGLFMVPGNYDAVPVNVSKAKIPEELVGIPYDYENPTVTLQYDSRYDIIHINDRNSSGEGWIFDVKTGGFHRNDGIARIWATCEFPGLMSVQSSGVLFGNEGGIQRIDRFASEQIRAQLVAGPIKLGNAAVERSIIKRLRVIFARDTPTTGTEGTISIYAGVDAQDAVSHLMSGRPTYTVDVQQLKANGGQCWPNVAGSAVCIAINVDVGDLGFELMEMETVPLGPNRMQRIPQLAVTGSPLNITSLRDDFDDSVWVGKQTIDMPDPLCTLPDYTLFFDLSLLDNDWWSFVNVTGGDIRVTDASGAQLPVDVIEFDKAAKTGLIAFRRTVVPGADNSVNVWCGRVNGVQPAVGASFGQYNAYDSYWRAFFPIGGGNDRTRYLNNPTSSNAITVGDFAGPIGAAATDYSLSTSAYQRQNNFATANSDLSAITAFTLVSAGIQTTLANNTNPMLAISTDTSNQWRLEPRITGGGPNVATRAGVQSSGGSEEADSPTNGLSTLWHHFAAVHVLGSPSRKAYFDGDTGTEDIATETQSFPLDNLFIGAGTQLPNASVVNYAIALAQVHSTERSRCWIEYQYRLMDQATFWDISPDFDEENPPTPDIPEDSPGCPAGEVPTVETGTWSGYATAAVPAVLDDHPGFTALIDLENMPADWWTACEGSGDIRATDQDNIFLPIDVFNFDATAQTGVAAVRLRANSAAVTHVRLWVGNSAAETPPACGHYGQYAAYDPGWLGFWAFDNPPLWPFPGNNNERGRWWSDRTIWNRFGESRYMDPITDGAIGNFALRMTERNVYTVDGVTLADTGRWRSSINGDWNGVETGPEGSMFIVARMLPPGQDNRPPWAALVTGTVVSTSPKSTVFVQGQISTQTPGATHAREFIADKGWSTNASVAFDAAADAGDWFVLSAGFADDNVSVPVFVNDTEDLVSQIKPYETNSGSLTNFFIGGVLELDAVVPGNTGDGTRGAAFYRSYCRFDVAYAGIRNGLDGQAWNAAWYAMLDQPTFWGSWTWTASSSSLPQ